MSTTGNDTPLPRPPELDEPVYWFVILERALDRGNLDAAAAAQRELVRLAAYQAIKDAEEDSDAKAPIRRRAHVADVTVEKLAVVLQDNPAGLLLARDELAGWVASFNQYKARGGADLANWLEMHRAGQVMVDRKNGTSVYVPHAAVSVCGTIQPGILKKALNHENRSAGLGARLLLTLLPKRSRVWSEAVVAPDTFDAYAAVVHGLFKLNQLDKPIAIPLDADAKRLFVDFVPDWGREADEHDDDLAAAWSKLEAYAPRFALIFHLTMTYADLAPSPIAAASMAAGVTLARWFGKEAERIYAILDADEAGDERRLLDFIRGRGGQCTPRDVMTFNRRRYPTANDAEAALRALVKAGLGWFPPPTSGPKGGHPASAFRLR